MFITGRIGIPILCNFSWVLRTGGECFLCVRNYICRLSMIELHSFIVLFISFWNLLVGSLVRVLKFLVVMKDCTLSAYSLESMIATLLPLSACVTIALYVCSYLFSSFTIYNCLFWSMLVWFAEFMICFSFFVAIKRYVFYSLSSRSLNAASVSAARLVTGFYGFFNAVV